MSGRRPAAPSAAIEICRWSCSEAGEPGRTYVRYTCRPAASSRIASCSSRRVRSRWRRWRSQMSSSRFVRRSTSTASSLAIISCLHVRTTSEKGCDWPVNA